MTKAHLARLAGAAIFLFSGCSSTAPTTSGTTSSPTVPSGSGKVVVLHFSDLHGQLRGDEKGGGYARVAAYVKKVVAEADPKTDVLVLFGGDLIGKTALPCRKTKEMACVPLLAKIGAGQEVIGVLGNHELYRTAAELDTLLDASGVRWVSSNVTGLRSKRITPMIAWQGARSGAKLTIRGWTQGETGRGLNYRATPTTGDWNAFTASAAGTPTIWLTHQSWAANEAFAKDLCGHPKINSLVILKGDEHVARVEKVECVKVIEPGAFGAGLTRLDFAISPQGGWVNTAEQIVNLDAQAAKDPELDAAITALYAQHAPEATEVVAQVGEARAPEQVADFLADVYRTVTHADVAVINRGAVKAGFESGDLSREELLTTIPYNNEIQGLDWAVKDLEAALCRSAQRARDPALDDGADLHLAGAKLLNAGTADCRLETAKRGSVKVAVDNYVVGKSSRWLGKDLQGKTFRFQVTTEQALSRYFKMKGSRL